MRISVFEGRLYFALILLIFFLGGLAVAEEDKTGRITGLMIMDGVPVTGSIVSFFSEETGPPPDPERYFRVPDFIVKVDDNGRFSADLLVGRYYLGAIKRMSGVGNAGTPREGDYLYNSRDENGIPKSYEVREGKTADIGTISGLTPYKSSSASKKDITIIEGTIVDAAGKPVKGAIIHAFKASADLSRPIFVSEEKTGGDGKYVLRVAGDMNYHLKAREAYGGPLRPGEFTGIYGGKEAVAISVKKGETIKRIDIKVTAFPERNPQGSKMFIE